MSATVAILGGGVAGMSAAMELAERGFQVQVFELKDVPGGKARSVRVPGTGKEGRQDLPGEHGFRFFPGFYRHVIDTMERIPYAGGKRVADNLVEATELELARFGLPPIVAPAQFPRSLTEIGLVLRDLFHSQLNIPDTDWEFYRARIGQLMTSCKERRIGEYEKISWWRFMGADSRSEDYQRYLVQGFSRSLVAAKAELASTRTIGDIYLQMLLYIVLPGCGADRLLNGPTSDVWINPWLDHLHSLGVDYQFESRLRALDCQDGSIRSAAVEQEGSTREVKADYYLAAVPIEVVAPLVTPAMIEADPGMATLPLLKQYVQWMNGAQYYLSEDVRLCHGHEIYVDSPWALTTVSQAQFWSGVDLSRYGDGTVRGILSVDISDWNAPGLNGKPAKQCTREEIKREVWDQMKRSLNQDGTVVLRDDQLSDWFLDPDIVIFSDPRDPAALPCENREPLLVNLVDTWRLRPDAETAIPNLFLASDYVRTHTDLATMEAANEAARRAVNGVLCASGSSAPRCRLWDLHEPEILQPFRSHDRARYDQGLPWNGHLFGL
jgi:uncharacterized protein with NAD-binding domain and iron-sulfur cluster